MYRRNTISLTGHNERVQKTKSRHFKASKGNICTCIFHQVRLTATCVLEKQTAEETSKPRALKVRNTDTEERQDGAHSFDSFEGVDWDRGCALSAETTPMPKPPPCLNLRKRPAAASAHASRSPGADVAFHHQFGRGERTKRHSFESAGLTARQEDSDTDTDLHESEIIRDITLVISC